MKIRFFPFNRDDTARAAITAMLQEQIAQVDIEIAYLQTLSQTHIMTLDGSMPIAEVIASHEAYKAAQQERIDALK